MLDARRLNGTVWGSAWRLHSSTWNRIVPPINFPSYLIFAHVVSFPDQIWPTCCSIQFLSGLGLLIATALHDAQSNMTVLFASGLLISPAVRNEEWQLRRKIKGKTWTVGCELAAYWAVCNHIDLYFLLDKCFWCKKWEVLTPFIVMVRVSCI